MTKTCIKCHAVKPVEEFQQYWNNQRNKHYRRGDCSACRSAHRRARGDTGAAAKRAKYATPEGRRALLSANHKWRYGITLDEKDAMLAAQGGVCAICKTDSPGERGWYTDHDHSCCPEIRSCGKCIRGILCKRCNFALGQFDDNPDVLQCAIDYLDSAAASRRLPA